ITHLFQSTMPDESVAFLEERLLLATIVFAQRIARHCGIGGSRVRDDTAVLNVESTNLGELTTGRTVRGDELGYHGDDLVRVHRFARPEERVVTHSVGVVLTTIWITSSRIAVRSRATST